ncbi:hypothetical protein [Burkholderia reimsis]|uniref:hypothetical protein n=1 Tax=Burkholderia reimsis TaxID=2234132 RepID=UPI001402FBB8|nr:hypothetical protein [Burkholderia reimsis]
MKLESKEYRPADPDKLNLHYANSASCHYHAQRSIETGHDHATGHGLALACCCALK